MMPPGQGLHVGADASLLRQALAEAAEAAEREILSAMIGSAA